MSAVLVVQDEAVSSSPGPREGGPRRRRAFTGRKPGEKIGRPSAEQAEIARLTRELDVTRRRLAKTEAALDLVGKAHALGGVLRESGHRERAEETLTGCYDDLVTAGVRTRDAAAH